MTNTENKILSAEKIITGLVLSCLIGVISAWISLHNFKIKVEQQMPRIETALIELASSNTSLSHSINKFDKSISLFERDRVYILKQLEARSDVLDDFQQQLKQQHDKLLELEFKRD